MTTIGAIQLRLSWVGPALSRSPNWLSQAGVIPDRQTRRFSNMVPCNRLWCSLWVEGAMRPDRVEVLWDAAKSKWLIRIETGEEVIRRHCDVPKNADDQTLRSAVQKAVEDEGHELDPTSVSIRR